MGFFKDLMRRKTTPQQQQPLAIPNETISVKKLETTLEPITINLNSQQFQCNSHGRWCPVNEPATGRMHEEVIRLRKEKVSLEKEILKYARQEQEMKQLKEKLNLMDLKYKVLVEMWTQNKVNRGDDDDDDQQDEDEDEDQDQEPVGMKSDFERKGSKFIWPKDRYS